LGRADLIRGPAHEGFQVEWGGKTNKLKREEGPRRARPAWASVASGHARTRSDREDPRLPPDLYASGRTERRRGRSGGSPVAAKGDGEVGAARWRVAARPGRLRDVPFALGSFSRR
jgi:hypothetical protein